MGKTLDTTRNEENMTEEQSGVLNTISGGIKKKFTEKTRPSVYYKPVNGRDLSIHFISEEYDTKVEDKIYNLEASVISKYLDRDINFRLTPKHGISENRIAPSGFKKLHFA